MRLTLLKEDRVLFQSMKCLLLIRFLVILGISTSKATNNILLESHAFVTLQSTSLAGCALLKNLISSSTTDFVLLSSTLLTSIPSLSDEWGCANQKPEKHNVPKSDKDMQPRKTCTGVF